MIELYYWTTPNGHKIADFPHLEGWFETIAARSATIAAYAKAKEINPRPAPAMGEGARKILFGQTARM